MLLGGEWEEAKGGIVGSIFRARFFLLDLIVAKEKPSSTA